MLKKKISNKKTLILSKIKQKQHEIDEFYTLL